MHASLTRRMEYALSQFGAPHLDYPSLDLDQRLWSLSIRSILEQALAFETGLQARGFILEVRNTAERLHNETGIPYFRRMHDLLHDCYNETIVHPE